MARVFLSYAREDLEAARMLAGVLAEALAWTLAAEA